MSYVHNYCVTDEECNELYDEFCIDLTDNFNVQQDINIKLGPTMKILIWLSFLASGLQGLLMVSNRKMRKTFGIIMIITIFEALFFGNLVMSTLTCKFKFPDIFAQTVLWDIKGELTWA